MKIGKDKRRCAWVNLNDPLMVEYHDREWGVPLHTLVVALIGLHQLSGPLLFRMALGRASEIGRAAGGEMEALPAES